MNELIEPVRHPVRRSIALILLYSMLGPPIGGFIVVILFLALAGSRSDIVGQLVILPLVLAGSYFLGFVPAFVTGIAAARLVQVNGAVSMIAITAIGAGAAFLSRITFDSVSDPSSFMDMPRLGGGLVFAGLGAAAAAVCRRVGTKLHGATA